MNNPIDRTDVDGLADLALEMRAAAANPDTGRDLASALNESAEKIETFVDVARRSIKEIERALAQLQIAFRRAELH